MEDDAKTKKTLIAELTELRRRCAAVEVSESRGRDVKAGLLDFETLTMRIVDTVREPLVVLDGKLRVFSANRSFYETFRVKPELTEGRFIFEIGNRQWDIPKLRELLSEILPGETFLENYEVEHNFEDIGRRVMLLNARRILEESGEATMILLAIEDITERRQKQDLLMAEKEQFEVTLRGIGDGVIATDIDGNVVLMNEVAEKLTAWPQADAIGKPLDKIFRIIDEKTRELCENPFERVLEKGIVVGLTDHTVLIARDGTERCVADSGAPIWDHNFDMNGVVVVFRDITNQRRGELEQQKAEKLQSVGVLAGGIAHDFNNFLTVILGNINFAKMLIKPEDEIYALLNEVEKASQSAKGLTHQLLTFSKGGLPVKKDMSLLDLIHDSAGFVLRGSNVGCEYNLPDDLWHADVDEGQLTQVLHNLMINAVQAMPTGGKIEVEGENVIVGEGSPLPLKKGKYVRISLKDHGTGIAKENLPFIFDPYFSTKKKGSGLGLSTTYSIIHQHDGYLSVDSEAGAGATFQFYLPASKKKFRKKVVPEKIPELSRARFLIMDDEEAILELLRKFMAKVGLDAEFATGGEEAVEKYKAAKGSARPFDVVVLDLTVPGGMGGREAMRRLKELDPTAKAIVSSGYSNDSILSNYHEFGFSEVLSKPYDMHELMEKLYKVLRATKE